MARSVVSLVDVPTSDFDLHEGVSRLDGFVVAPRARQELRDTECAALLVAGQVVPVALTTPQLDEARILLFAPTVLLADETARISLA